MFIGYPLPKNGVYARCVCGKFFSIIYRDIFNSDLSCPFCEYEINREWIIALFGKGACCVGCDLVYDMSENNFCCPECGNLGAEPIKTAWVCCECGHWMDVGDGECPVCGKDEPMSWLEDFEYGLLGDIIDAAYCGGMKLKATHNKYCATCEHDFNDRNGDYYCRHDCVHEKQRRGVRTEREPDKVKACWQKIISKYCLESLDREVLGENEGIGLVKCKICGCVYSDYIDEKCPACAKYGPPSDICEDVGNKDSCKNNFVNLGVEKKITCDCGKELLELLLCWYYCWFNAIGASTDEQRGFIKKYFLSVNKATQEYDFPNDMRERAFKRAEEMCK